MPKAFNWIGVLVALIFGQALSYVWYSIAFGAAERALNPSAPSGGLVYAKGGALSLLLIVGLAWLVSKTGVRGWVAGARFGLLFWLFFLLTTGLIRTVYLGSPLRQEEIDAGYELIFLTSACAILAGLTLGKRAAAIAA